MDARVAEALISPSGQKLIGLAEEFEGNALARGDMIRAQQPDAEIAAAVSLQVELRRAAQAKLGDFANRMLFTRSGLEQATALAVAAEHADRFRAAGISSVADLTAGLGVDSMAYAGLGLTTVSVEHDHATALLAEHNLSIFPHAHVVHGDAIEVGKGIDISGVYADPARRNTHARVTQPEHYLPSLSSLLGLRDSHEALGIKLAPGIPKKHLPSEAEHQWLSLDGEVKECAVWCGPLAHAYTRSALVLRTNGKKTEVRDQGSIAEVGALGDFLYEPDNAVIRAGLVAEVAQDVKGHLIHPTIAYVTSDTEMHVPSATMYRIRDVLPATTSTLRSYVRSHNIGTLTIKKRGMDISPEHLRKEISPRGDNAATIILTRAGNSRKAIVADRLYEDSSSVRE